MQNQFSVDLVSPKGVREGSRDIFKFWQISDIISETVPYRDLVIQRKTNKKSYVSSNGTTTYDQIFGTSPRFIPRNIEHALVTTSTCESESVRPESSTVVSILKDLSRSHRQ